jgi:hypothetical protein
VREAERSIARAGEEGVTLAVALERPARAVEVPAVGLDDEPLGGEKEVDLEARDFLVDLWACESVGVADREHELFELALRERGPGVVLFERGSEDLRPSLASVRVDRRRNRSQVEELEDLGLVERSLECAATQ